MNVKGRISSKRMLINYLNKSHSLFERLQSVTLNDELKEKFGHSTLNIEESIDIIETKLTRNEIKSLVSQLRENIEEDKFHQE